MLDVHTVHEVRRYWDTDQITPASSDSARALGFDPSSIADASPLCSALDALADVAQARLGTFGLFIALTDGFRQRVVAAKWNYESDEEEAPHWLARDDADKDRWLWLARQSTSLEEESLPGTLVVRLDENEQTADLSCVKAYPNLRYYAAAPIVTNNNIAIGTVFLVDIVHRRDSERRDLDLLARMARKSMAQLESSRAVHLRHRITNASNSLNSFALSRKITAQLNDEPPPLRRKAGQSSSSSSDNGVHPNQGLDDQAKEFVRSELQRESDNQPGKAEKESPSTARHETTYRQTFTKAAEVLQRGMDFDGVAFIDGIVGFRGVLVPVAEPEIELQNELFQLPELRKKPSHERGASTQERSHQPSTPPPNIGGRDQRTFTSTDYGKSVTSGRPAEVLGIAMKDNNHPELVDVSPTTVALKSLDEAFLQKLLERFAHGKIWYYEEDGTPFTFTADDRLIDVRDDRDACDIAASFPGIRQLFFAPLTDPTSLKRLAGCIAWSIRVTPTFTEDSDLGAFRSFLFSVESEISRIDAMSAVKQQEAFVSSVSHELRTPLHGILGAVEFLSETSLDEFQQGLAESIRSCGSTLHDTLSSVLSYAQINQFERRRNKPLQRTLKDLPWALEDKEISRQGEGIEDVCCSANLATLCEEVVEVTASGYTYNKSTSLSAEDLSIILDIPYRVHWNFLTEPGALRRILINILGNALKYTPHGFVKVSLAAHSVDEDTDRKLIQITVMDSGKGMSNKFLQNHLFLPFTQEDTVGSEGVGLGMSIVKSLISLLGGKIHVDSKLNQGSTFTVSIPMYEDSNPEPTSSSSAALLEAVRLIRQQSRTVVICGLDGMLRDSLTGYFEQWFQWKVLELDGKSDACIDVLVVNQADTEAKEKACACLEHGSFVLLTLLTTPSLSRSQGLLSGDLKEQVAMAWPVGPLKLSKAILACTNRLAGISEAKDMPLEVVTGQNKRDTRGIKPSTTQVPQKQREESQTPEEQHHGFVQVANSESLTDLPRSELSPAKRSPCLLLVEDNVVNLKLLKTFLTKHGCKDIRTAENGQFAVEEVMNLAEASRTFDIIFMDISMPVMDGFLATVAIRNIERETRDAGKSPLNTVRPTSYIIALTGLASARDEERAYRSGIDLVLTKPVKFKELTKLLERWKEGRDLKVNA